MYIQGDMYPVLCTVTADTREAAKALVPPAKAGWKVLFYPSL